MRKPCRRSPSENPDTYDAQMSPFNQIDRLIRSLEHNPSARWVKLVIQEVLAAAAEPDTVPTPALEESRRGFIDQTPGPRES